MNWDSLEVVGNVHEDEREGGGTIGGGVSKIS